MDKQKKLFELIELFSQIVSKFSFVDNLIVDFTGLNLKLYKSEVHMIKYIKDYPDTNVTQMSKLLGVTKGAVSQVLNKLVKKKLIIKINRKTNEKEIFLKLTNLGEEVYKIHNKLHKERFKDFYSLMVNLPDKQIVFVENIFNMIDNLYDKMIEEKSLKNNIYKV